MAILTSLTALWISVFLLAAAPVTAHAETPDPARPDLETLTARVEQAYREVRSLRAVFSQSATNTTLGQAQTAWGKVYIKKPDLMRWDYEEPERQYYIADGENIWFYQPEDNQVTVGKITPELRRSPLFSFLSGVSGLTEHFRVAYAPAGTKPSPGAYLLELTPRQVTGNIEKVLLVVDAETYRITETRVFDALGNVTLIRLSRVEENVRLNDRVFEFKPPQGVEIIRMD